MQIITSFCDEEKDDLAQETVSHLLQRYPVIGHGLYRVVFRIGTHVFKFPLNEGGEFCNDGEASYRCPEYALGRYVTYRGFVCVMQETVEPCSEDHLQQIRDLPEYEWLGGIDCEQVGVARDGTIKAYDFVHP